MKKTLWILTVVLGLAGSQFALAAEQEATPDQAGDTEMSHHRWPEVRWALDGSLRYYSLYNGSNLTTFGPTGNLESPKSYAAGFELGTSVTCGHGWQIGLGIGSLGNMSDNGFNTANFSQVYFGPWFGKEFEVTDRVDASLGTLVGYGLAQTDLVNNGPSGKTSETTLMLEPKLMVAYRFTRWFKLGLSGSWLIPTWASQKIRGQNLTNNAPISARGPSGGVELILGNFKSSSQ